MSENSIVKNEKSFKPSLSDILQSITEAVNGMPSDSTIREQIESRKQQEQKPKMK